MVNPKDLPLIISSLQLLALKEILQSPSFEAKNKEELKWLFDLIDKTATIDAVSKQIWAE
jgi:hypothetical protein